MKTLEIHVPDDVASKLEAAAHDRGVSVDELLRASVEEKLARDAAFDAASRYVLDKNAVTFGR